jgi:hypothetical protein
MGFQITLVPFQGRTSIGKYIATLHPISFVLRYCFATLTKDIAVLAYLYRPFKQLVQRTNKRDVEKVLLQHESFRRTLLLLIEGAFAEDEPDLSARLQAMYRQCPQIFKDFLHLSDPEPDDESDDSDDETEPDEIISLDNYQNIRPWSFMTSREVQQKFQIPLRLSDLPIGHLFSQLLRDAYETDYGRPHIVNLGTNQTKWCRKVSFVIGYCHT